MKLFSFLTVLTAVAFASVNPQLHEVKRVYILAMGSGMDQYLANQLTNAGLFEVVTDPKRADAIVTDNVGESFQKRLDDLYAPPPAPKNSDSSAPDTPKKDGLAGLDFGVGTTHSGSFGRGKGTFFVVDRSSRTVLWSVYERPKNSTPHELSKTAARVVKHLKDDLTDKKPSE